MFSELGPTILEYSVIKNNSVFIELLINLGWNVLIDVNSSKHYLKQDFRFKAGLYLGLNQVHEALGSQILKNPKDGDSTRFLENLLH